MIYICIPSHDEERTIGILLWKIRQVLTAFPRDYQLLVLDDASTDRTRAVLAPYARILPLTVMAHPEPRGYAAALDELIREAVRRSEYPRRDVVLTLQADFTEDPDEIPTLLKRIESGADVVTTRARIAPEHAPRAVRWTRALMGRVLRRLKWPEGVTDALTGLRAYRVIGLKKALDERAGARLVDWSDPWAANAALLRVVQPHVRRVDEVETTLRPDRRQRPTRFHAPTSARALLRLAFGRKPTVPVPGRQGGATVLSAETLSAAARERGGLSLMVDAEPARRGRGGRGRAGSAAGQRGRGTAEEERPGRGRRRAEPAESGPAPRERGARARGRAGEEAAVAGEAAEAGTARSGRRRKRGRAAEGDAAPPLELAGAGAAAEEVEGIGGAPAAPEEAPAAGEAPTGRKSRRRRSSRRRRGQGAAEPGEGGVVAGAITPVPEIAPAPPPAAGASERAEHEAVGQGPPVPAPAEVAAAEGDLVGPDDSSTVRAEGPSAAPAGGIAGASTVEEDSGASAGGIAEVPAVEEESETSAGGQAEAPEGAGPAAGTPGRARRRSRRGGRGRSRARRAGAPASAAAAGEPATEPARPDATGERAERLAAGEPDRAGEPGSEPPPSQAPEPGPGPGESAPPPEAQRAAGSGRAPTPWFELPREVGPEPRPVAPAEPQASPPPSAAPPPEPSPEAQAPGALKGLDVTRDPDASYLSEERAPAARQDPPRAPWEAGSGGTEPGSAAGRGSGGRPGVEGVDGGRAQDAPSPPPPPPPAAPAGASSPSAGGVELSSPPPSPPAGAAGPPPAPPAALASPPAPPAALPAGQAPVRSLPPAPPASAGEGTPGDAAAVSDREDREGASDRGDGPAA